MRVRRRLGLLFLLLFLGGGAALAFYVREAGFTRKWRNLIAEELASHGLKAEIGRLTLDPVEGLTARDVKLFDLTPGRPHIAEISRITLDVDVGRLVTRENFLRSIQLQGANLNVPVDPEDRGSERLTVQNLNARLVLQGDSIEVRNFEGVIAGISLKLHGTMRRPPPRVLTKKEEDTERIVRKRQMKEIRDRRGIVRSLLRELERFESPGGADRQKAELEVEVHGELSNLPATTVHAQLRTGPLTCGAYSLTSLTAEADLAAGEVTLRSLKIKDRAGHLEAAAAWKLQDGAPVRFSVQSSIDAERLMRELAGMPPPWEPHAVLHGSPVVNAEGIWEPGGEAAPGFPPLRIKGSVSVPAFSVPGKAGEAATDFTGFKSDFSLRPDGSVYLRNAELTRAGGQSVSGTMLWDPADGLRYHFDWRMALSALGPLLQDANVRRALQEVEFGPEAVIQISGDGTCGSTEPRVLRHKGKLDLRNFTARSVAISQFSADMELVLGPTPGITLNNFVLQRPEGVVKGRTLAYDIKSGLIGVSEGFCSADHVAIATIIGKKLAADLGRYRFSRPAELTVSGAVDVIGPERTALRIGVRSQGRASVPVGSDTYDFDQVRGYITLTGNVLGTHLIGQTVPGTLVSDTVRLTEAGEARIDGDFGLSAATRSATDYVVRIDRPITADLLLLGKVWPVFGLQAVLRCNGQAMALKTAGKLFGGPIAADLDWADLSTGVHTGNLTMTGIGFRGVGDRFNAERTSEGRLSGTFRWTTGKGPRGLTGEGKLSLKDGNIFALPLLGPLSALVDALVPGKDLTYSIARDASATLRVENGIITIPDFKALTPMFELTSDGGIDYVADRVDADATLNFRGVVGIPFFLVSRLLEYTAEGTTATPGWHLKVLSNPFRKKQPLGGGGEEKAGE